MKIICFVGQKKDGKLVNIREFNKLTEDEKAKIKHDINIQACTAVNYILKKEG